MRIHPRQNDFERVRRDDFPDIGHTVFLTVLISRRLLDLAEMNSGPSVCTNGSSVDYTQQQLKQPSGLKEKCPGKINISLRLIRFPRTNRSFTIDGSSSCIEY